MGWKARGRGFGKAIGTSFAAFALATTGASGQTGQAGQIVIESPAEWAPGSRGLTVVRNRSLRVTGRVSHPAGIAQVAINQTPFFLSQLADGAWRFDGYVEMTERVNSVTVRAMSRDGAEFSESYPLSAELPGASASPSERWGSALADFKGERWAVVVGISDYQNPGVPDLKFADRDAQEFAAFLRTPAAGLGGFDFDKVLLLTNEEATYRNLRSALFTFLKNPTEDDVVYVFWAGHGSPDPDRLNDLYLLPHDVDPNDIAATAIRMEDLQDAMRRSKARDKIILTDACHSGGVGFEGTRAMPGVNQINAAFVERLAGSIGGSVAITSSEASQVSSEGLQWGGGHGAFTFHLLDGLRGAADEDGDQIVDVREMFEYVREAVKRDTKSGQIPTISQSAYNAAWPMAAVFRDPAEMAGAAREQSSTPGASVAGSVLVNLMEGTWSVPDSLNAFVGVVDTVAIRLNGRAGPKVDGTLLAWSSSNPSVAQVTREGALVPQSPGMTTVSASFYNERRVELAVRVYDRPLQVEFSPRVDTLEVVRGDQVRLTASMELPTGEIIRGMLPAFEISDSLIVALARSERDQVVEGEFRALREGSGMVRGTLAGLAHTWNFKVGSPGLAIRGIGALLLAGDEVDVRAMYTRRDGTPLSEALGVSWESSDTTVLGVRLGGVVAKRPGRALLVASSGASRDTAEVNVLGDLLISSERRGKSRLLSLSVAQVGVVQVGGDDIGATEAVLSPDGSLIAMTAKREGDRGPRIHLADVDGQGIRRLVGEKKGRFLSLGLYFEGSPAWSYDGRFVYFSSNRDGNYDIYRLPVDEEGGEPERIVRDGSVDRGVRSSPDGPRIAFERVVDQDDSDIILALGDGSEEVNFTANRLANGLSRKRPREVSPSFLPGNLGVVLLDEEPDGVDGQSLARFDIATGQRLSELVRPQSGQEILYAVSPRGDQVAYHQRPRRGSAEPRIVIVDLNGTALQTLLLPAEERILSLSWGAVSAAPIQGR